MQIHGPGHVHGPHPVNTPHRTHPAQAAEQSRATGAADELDISDAARALSQAREIPEIRQDRVAEIRSQIEAGIYETDEKMEAAVERLLDEIG